jgi:hypothetical protein
MNGMRIEAGGEVDEEEGAEAEFPALPETVKPKNDVKKPPRPAQARTTSDALSAADGKETWADQVESSEAAKQT